jgi:hypothetical protein
MTSTPRDTANFAALLDGVKLPFHPDIAVPVLHRVILPAPHGTPVVDVRAAAHDSVKMRFDGALRAGATVAVGAGSRGLTGRVEMIAGVVDGLRSVGADPFVVPAMGSHGGGTADGQREVLTGYGITEDSVGAEIRATMETVEVARTVSNVPMFLDRHAAGADFFFPVNRLKPHTCFKGPLESGLSKMAVVGFGKQPGAAQIHASGPEVMRQMIIEGIAAHRETGRLLGGLASIENGAGDVVVLEALLGSEIGAAREIELTDVARTHVSRLPFAPIDVLIIEKIGKDISGVMMDPNVTGRFWVNGFEGEPTTATIVVLGLTDVSHGNALGIGLADFITTEVAAQVDWHKTYVNCFTAGPAGVRRSRMPMALPSEDDAIKAALSMCGRPVSAPKRVVRIRSTLHLEEMWVSDALLDELPTGVVRG